MILAKMSDSNYLDFTYIDISVIMTYFIPNNDG